jgi:hypothetical protein
MTPVFDLFSLLQTTYRTLWIQRAYIIRLSVIPILIMCANTALAEMAAPPTLLRYGLYMIPASVAEAWLVCQYLRTLMTGEKWPYIGHAQIQNGIIPPAVQARVRGLLSGMIVYVLSSLVLFIIAGTVAALVPEAMAPSSTASMPQTPPDPMTSFWVILIAILLIWHFRFLWAYIPMIINVPLSEYTALTKPWRIRIQFLGAWFAATLPMMIVPLMIVAPLLSLKVEGTGLGFIVFILALLFNVILQTLTTLAGAVSLSLCFTALVKIKGNRHGP